MIPRHADVERLRGVIPIQGYATVQVAGPLFRESVVLSQAFYQVLDVFFVAVFYSEVIDNQGEC